MQAFLDNFIQATSSEHSPNEISAGLAAFRNSINPEIVRKETSQKIIHFFKSIFKQLLKCCESESSIVRVSSFPALTSFLSKMTRTFSMEIQKAFIIFATKCVYVTKGSILIIFSFSYISHFIAKPFFEDFFNSVPIYHHFVNCNSGDLAHVIRNLPEMSKDNLTTILMSFIIQYQKTLNSKLLIPIQKIVEINPSYFLDEIYNSKEISLISFIFSTINVNANKYDLHDIALNALKKLQNAQYSDRDDCFHLLSVKSKSFSLSFKLISDSILNDSEKHHKKVTSVEISLDDQTIELNIDDFKNTPSFYSLSLPNSLLFPDFENDIPSVIAAKFKTIQKKLSDSNSILDVEEYIELYEKWLVDDFNKTIKYNENISSALKSFAASLPCLIANAKTFRLILILKSILKMKIKSWIHGLDILKVLESLNLELISFISLKERIELLLFLSMNKRDNLSISAIELIEKLTNESNFYEITHIISHKIDLFSPVSLQKHLNILARIIRKHQELNRKHLEFILQMLISIHSDYIFDFNTLAEIFNFSQYFPNNSDKLTNIAYSILLYSVKYIKGVDLSLKASFINPNIYNGNNTNAVYDKMIDQYLNSKSIDIVSDKPFSFKHNYPLISYAYCYYMAQNIDKRNSINLIEYFFEYFPYESTCRLLKINDSKFIENLYPKLMIVTDPHTIAHWIKLYPNENMVVYASYYVLNCKGVCSNDLYHFFMFLHSYQDKYEDIIRNGLLSIDPFVTSKFMFRILGHPDFILKYSTQLNKKTSVFCDNFDLMDDEVKIEYIKAFINENQNYTCEPVNHHSSTSSQAHQHHRDSDTFLNSNLNICDSPLMINFGLNNLSGWQKKTFEFKIRKKNDEKDRAFNPHFRKRVRDDLQDQLQYYININNKDRIKFILRMAVIKGYQFDMTSLHISKVANFIIFKFFKKRNIDTKTLLPITVYSTNLLNRDFVRKWDIVYLCQNIKYIDVKPNCLLSFLEKCQRHYKSILLFMASYLEKVSRKYKTQNNLSNENEHLEDINITIKNNNKIDVEVVDFLFEKIKKESQPENARETAYVILMLSKLIIFNDDQMTIVRSLFTICGLNSIEVAHLFSSIITSINHSRKGNNMVLSNLHNVIINYLDGIYPSQFLAGIQILHQVVSSIDEKSQNIAEPLLPKIISKIFDNPKQIYLTDISLLFKIILSNPRLESLHSIISSRIVEIISSFISSSSNNFLFITLNQHNSNPIFNSLSSEFTKLIPLVLNLTYPDIPLYHQLVKISEDELEIKNMKATMNFLNNLSIHIKKAPTQEHKNSVLNRNLQIFIEKFKGCDSYSIFSIFLEFSRIIKRNFPLEKLFVVLSDVFLTNSNRFFPVFAVVAGVIKKLNTQVSNEILEQSIKKAQQNIHNEAHKYAIDHLKNIENIQETLGIALLENDYLE
ncbi:hypothetical protein TRFO_23713 [Tritrichomonas foetus]|uniref:Uncharacterized protein n=1 Tax=Tritrichomonas foetus TaxID=1144522 RepID=A0A1J4K928_9EUKA|nr:hypothetical protein TRFO_23713 [Tritrichomonas foetus]|eukprot:OHT08001.1 hypothetical protein TRFO_23713 [Tritrichomonas foetus]